MANQEQVTTTQDKPQEEMVPVSIITEAPTSISTEAFIKPTQGNEQKEQISTGENNPASINTGTNGRPNMDMEDLNELLQQFGSSRANGRA